MALRTDDSQDTKNPSAKDYGDKFDARAAQARELRSIEDNFSKSANPAEENRKIQALKDKESGAYQPKEFASKWTAKKLPIRNVKKSKAVWWAVGGSAGIGGIAIAIIFFVLPFQLTSFLNNITSLASSVPEYAVNQRVEYLITRALATRLIAKVDDLSDVDSKLVFCSNPSSITCNLFATYSNDYFEKKLGIDLDIDTKNSRSSLGGVAREWDVTVQKGDGVDKVYERINTKSNGEMKRIIRDEVNSKTKRHQIITRFLARKLLMMKYGVSFWRGPPAVERAVNAVAAATANIKSSVIANTLGKISPKMAEYLSCLQGEVKVCQELRKKLATSLNVPDDPTKDPNYDPDSPEGKNAKAKYDAAKGLQEAWDKGEKFEAPDSNSTIKKFLSKKVLATLGGVGAAAGILDLVFRAVNGIKDGALESVWFDMASRTYVGFSTVIQTTVEKAQLGDLDLNTLGVVNSFFEGALASPLAQAENGLGSVSSLSSGVVTKCGGVGEEEVDVKLASGELVCPEQKLVRSYSAWTESVPGWDALTEVAEVWSKSIGKVFDVLGGGISWLLEKTGVNALIGKIFESLNLEGFISWFMGLVFDPPLVGDEASGTKNYVALSGGIRATQGELMSLGVSDDGTAMGGGGSILQESEQIAIYNDYLENKNAEFNSQSLIARIFDVNLSGSFLNKLALMVPSSFSGFMSLPSKSLSLALSANTAGAVDASLINPFGMVMYGYGPESEAFSASPGKYTESFCSNSAAKREESFKKIDGYLIPVYTKSDPCALEKMVVGSELEAEGVTDDPYSFRSLSDIAEAPVSKEVVGDPSKSSVNVDCAPGTLDAGVEDGYHDGKLVKMRLCYIPGMTEDGKKDKLPRVNSRVSGVWLSLINDLKQDIGRKNIDVTESFRTMERQQYLYKTLGSGIAEDPGYSPHQTGLSMDLVLGTDKNGKRPIEDRVGDPIYDWMVKNASKYGGIREGWEAWHWGVPAS